MKPEILFLFSDTGGGHRSATEAVIEAIHLEYGDAVSTRMLDFIKQYAPRPFNYLPRMYPTMVRVPAAWGLGFRLSDRSHQRKLITSTMWPMCIARCAAWWPKIPVI
jgi:1,2-diacylglycerol 3-beta-galactosyltransferase